VILADEYLEAAERLFEQYGISTFRVERRAKHRALVVSHGGKEHTVIIPSTGSDHRGPANTVSLLRRLLGLRRTRAAEKRPAPAKTANPTRHLGPRDRRVARARCDEPVHRVDRFYEPLARLKAQLNAEASRRPGENQSSSAPEMPAMRLRTPWLGPQVRYLAPSDRRPGRIDNL
jgi:hypothetical protein